MAIKVGINGFGRIGRNIMRAALDNEQIEFVAVNDLTDAKTLGYLLKYDSILGNLSQEVKVEGDSIIVGRRKIKVLSEKDPASLPWSELGVDIAIEATGIFRDRDGAEKHISAGAKVVIISAPAKGEDITIVMGVNESMYEPGKHHILSNASCTTNCLAPVAKVLLTHFGIKKGLMTTIHSYTNDQKILDFPHKDLRRSRAAALSMILTTTGAASATAKVLPALKGKMDGLAIRVPTPNVSLVDFVAELEKETTVEEVNAALKRAAEGEMSHILEYCEEPLVSRDFNGNASSSIVDAGGTQVIGGNLVKVLSWYDNEWAYSCRVIELTEYVYKKGL